MNPRIAVALLLLGLLALGAILLAAGGDDDADPVAADNAFAGALMPEGLPAPDFELENQEGERVSMRSLRGQPVLVTFLYTHCEDSCPAQAQVVKGALAELDEPVPALAVAVDPPNDTQQSARRFLVEQRVAGLDFVLGSRAELKPLWKGFAIRPQAIQDEHQARFTLVDKRGYQRIGFPGEYATPELLAHDLRLLQEE